MKKQFCIFALCAGLTLSGCGISWGMKVGDYTVPRSTIDYFAENAVFQTNGDEAAARKSAVEEIELIYLSLAVGKAMNVEISEDALQEQRQQMLDSYGGEKAYKKYLKEEKLPEQFMEDLLLSMQYQDGLLAQMNETDPLDDADYREYFLNHYRRAKHILLSTENAEQGEKAQILSKAQGMLAQLQNGNADMDALIAEYSEDPGSALNPDGYVFTDNEMVAAFEKGVDSIGMNEYTIAETDYGYHIIQRLPLDETQELYQAFYQKVDEAVKAAAATEHYRIYLHNKAQELGIEVTVR